MADHRDPFEASSNLRERVHEVGARFLFTEVQAGMALLDVASTSLSQEDNERRRALAVEAYETVIKHLARTGSAAVRLSAEKREEISRACAELGARLGR